ncbi:M20/M25/M40 family metallo-hydrolase [Engelhardtia mirabilis]|uniref:M20/M25/M40 family metallo-hydrolase n=1 Tax=Engelhardtia mirabilis TaxID=2528011 RepID=UPI003AF3E179
MVAELLDWIEVASVSGTEAPFTDLARRALERRGLDVEPIDVGAGRASLFARVGSPRVVLCTHLDTVPPWFGARADRTHVHGRGACDAKGVALAMAEASRRLVDGGLGDFGLLWTVGEEVDSDGALAAQRALVSGALELDQAPSFIVVGEPTGNRFVRGHKGMLRAALRAKGVPSHSSDPRGPSAVHALVGCCARLIGQDWGQHPVFGAGSLNVGVIAGGVADNVVAGEAHADLLVRAVEGPKEVEARLRGGLSGEVELDVHVRYGPVEFLVPEGEPAEVVAFGTDAPYLPAWGQPLLMGPGDIADAHTEHERIAIGELERGIARYVDLVPALLERAVAQGTRG